MPRVALALEERTNPEAVLDFLETLARRVKSKGCQVASPAPGSWLIAACSHTLLVTYPYPGPNARLSPVMTNTVKVTILLVIEGPPQEIAELVNLVLETAQPRGLLVTPTIL